MNILVFTLLLSVSMQTQLSSRKLLIFGKDQTEYKTQVAIFEKNSSGMAERDVVVSTVENESEYKKYNVAPNRFTVLLIGRDGSEKFRSTQPVGIETIFGLIDSMPMRQAEMKSREE